MLQKEQKHSGIVFIGKDKRPVTTSLVVAEKFERPHKDVLKSIRTLECSDSFNERNFSPVDYKDAKGESRPMYLITRDGFTLLAMGFTGAKAMKWKIKYIAAFNAMEDALRGGATSNVDLPKLDRVFGSAIRIAKQSGLSGRPMRIAANEATKSVTGYDVLAAFNPDELRGDEKKDGGGAAAHAHGGPD